MPQKDSVPWKTQTFGDKGALDDGQISRIAARYSIPLDKIAEHSLALTIALDPDRYLERDEMKPLLEEKGLEEVGVAIREIAQALEKLDRARARLENIRFKKPFGYHPGMTDPGRYHDACLNVAISDIVSFKAYLEVMNRNRQASARTLHDKRRARDERRRIVCNFIFRFWEDSGRNISYTTDPLTSERGGPLVNFAKDIIECLSDPPTRLSGDSIKSEIEYFKARRAAIEDARRQVARSRKTT